MNHVQYIPNVIVVLSRWNCHFYQSGMLLISPLAKRSWIKWMNYLIFIRILQNELTFVSWNILNADGEQANWTSSFHRSWYWIGYTGRVKIHSSTSCNPQTKGQFDIIFLKELRSFFTHIIIWILVNQDVLSELHFLHLFTDFSENSRLRAACVQIRMMEFVNIQTMSENVNKSHKGAIVTLRVLIEFQKFRTKIFYNRIRYLMKTMNSIRKKYSEICIASWRFIIDVDCSLFTRKIIIVTVYVFQYWL